MPYYIHHALIATGFLIVTYFLSGLFVSQGGRDVRRLQLLCGAIAGGMFYLGREIAQWEDNPAFDWPGLIAPVVAMVAVYSLFAIWNRKKPGE